MVFSDVEIKSNLREDGLGFVRFTKVLGKKRILISNSISNRASVRTPLKKPRILTMNSNSSLLESLHQDILIRVLCHVDHEDIINLKLVSKTIKEAVMKAKESYFDKCTPKKKLLFRDSILRDSNLRDEDDEIEPPNAPIRKKFIQFQADLSKISIVLFK